jgi:hypothetical protein
MKTERELLKEAAAQLEHLMSACDMTNHLEEETIMLKAKINAHLSQPDAVAMTLQQAKDKVALKRYGGKDWDEFKNDNPTTVLMELLMNEAAHLFMESNRVQRWIPVEERLPDVFDVLILVMQDAPNGKQYPVIKWAAYLKEENEFHTDYAQEWPTHWQPLPEVPGVYLEGNK